MRLYPDQTQSQLPATTLSNVIAWAANTDYGANAVVYHAALDDGLTYEWTETAGTGHRSQSQWTSVEEALWTRGALVYPVDSIPFDQSSSYDYVMLPTTRPFDYRRDARPVCSRSALIHFAGQALPVVEQPWQANTQYNIGDRVSHAENASGLIYNWEANVANNEAAWNESQWNRDTLGQILTPDISFVDKVIGSFFGLGGGCVLEIHCVTDETEAANPVFWGVYQRTSSGGLIQTEALTVTATNTIADASFDPNPSLPIQIIHNGVTTIIGQPRALFEFTPPRSFTFRDDLAGYSIQPYNPTTGAGDLLILISY